MAYCFTFFVLFCDALLVQYMMWNRAPLCLGAICRKLFYYILFFIFYCPVLTPEPVGLALDLEDYHPSVLLHCWLGHVTCKIVSEMTYNVSSGMLNPTYILYLSVYLSKLSCENG